MPHGRRCRCRTIDPYRSREQAAVTWAESLKSIGAITLFVDDPQRSKAFYTRVFEAEVLFEDANSAALRFDNLILNFLKRGAAVDELPALPGRRRRATR